MRTLYFCLPCGFFFFLLFFFPRLISAVADWMSTILTQMVWPWSNLGCRSETCCTRLAGIAGCKNDAKICHLGTIAQHSLAISSQLRHVSTIGKKLFKQQCLPTCPHNMVNFGPLVNEIHWRVWGTTANFNGCHVLAALLHGTVVVGVSQTLRH